eukprot:CAMPEP_0204902874 /NCGR_PEP_ID=MMETSP1397-20131031/3932_1 /ASSEMBLY_ACC=CAM_ASM_000891 /TAXON_ID=49980 /ORGANISM="Climacostomum Climacostomum virens, Strain Stock W-24" /LENGTH=375 /DNA_ID=CAMNT_0052071445 /DNA_START=21 /DNA_END=1148 /DNA_ORIENTATION=-
MSSPKESVKYQEATTLERDLPRTEAIRVYMVDSRHKTLTIEHFCFVSEVVRLMAESLGLRTWDHFGIFEQAIRNESLVEKPLKEEESLSLLTLQKLRRSDCRLIFKCKLFLELRLLDAEQQALHLYYIQICNYVTTGYYYASVEQSIALAARQLQAQYGAFNPASHLGGFLQQRLGEYFAPIILESADKVDLERKTLAAFSCLQSVSQEQSRRLYIIQALKLPTFGSRFFYVRQRKVKNLPEHLYLGVRSTGLLLARYNNRELIRSWSFDTISRWGFSEGSFHVQLKSYNGSYEMHWEFFTSEAEGVVALLDNYMNSLLSELDDDKMIPVSSTTNTAATLIQAAVKGFLVRRRLYNLQRLMAVRLIEYHWLRIKV